MKIHLLTSNDNKRCKNLNNNFIYKKMENEEKVPISILIYQLFITPLSIAIKKAC